MMKIKCASRRDARNFAQMLRRRDHEATVETIFVTVEISAEGLLRYAQERSVRRLADQYRADF